MELGTFRLLQNPSAWAWKKQCLFFHFIWRLLNTFRFFWQFALQKWLQIDYKDSGVLETRHKFLRTAPPFLDEYVVLKKCYLVGVECQIQDIITICPKKPALNCFDNPGNAGISTTRVYRFANTSTSLQICSTMFATVYNEFICLQNQSKIW
jgi:hypothetical protein